MATKFNSKIEAQAAIENFSIPCANPVWIAPIIAKFKKIEAGWYVGFPLNIDKRLVDLSEYGA